MAEASAADRMARLVLAALCLTAIFWVNYRFVLVHFSQGGDLLDTGWFAWILTSGDPWLANPRSVSDLSYFNYHLAPYLSALSVVFHATGLDRFTAFALHEGLVFCLFAGSLYGLVLTSWRGGRSALLFTAVAVFTVLGDVMLQVTSFPHPEVAIPAFCVLGSALWTNNHRRWGALAFCVATLVREDGGLYAAAFLFTLALLSPLSRRTLTGPEALLGAAGILVSLLMFWIKSRFFPGFSAFVFNYSGNNWDHLTADNIATRFRDFLGNPHALTAIVPALILAVLSWRYLILVVAMAPLILAQLLAARVQLWHFHAYYAMPFVVIWAGLVLVAAERARAGRLRWIEPAVLLAAAVLGSGPLLYAVRPPAWFPVAAAALVTPVADLPALADDVRTITAEPGGCVGMGIAALIPDDFAPAQVVDPGGDFSKCSAIYLFRADGHYAAMTWQLHNWQKTATAVDRIERYAQRP